jgi:predicted DNA-binding transcriptional regulator AlpA
MLYSVREAAMISGLNRKTIYKWIKKGFVYFEKQKRTGQNGQFEIVVIDVDDVLDQIKTNKGLPICEFEFEEWQLNVARKVFANVKN